MTTLDRDFVANLNLDGKPERFVFDTDPALTGFGIRLRNDRNGRLTKTWFVQYRGAEHQRRRKLGRFPTLNADAARKIAASWLSKVAEGKDPADDKDKRRSEAQMRFAKAVEVYLESKKTKVRASSLRIMSLYLKNERYFGRLHTMPVSRITKKHVSEALDAMDVQSGTVTASRAKAHLSAFCSWLMKGGHLDVNPCVGSRDFEQGDGRDRVLEDHELAAVWNNVDMDTDFGRIIRLLALTGARKQEIGSLRWDEVDLDKARINLPKERTKNGKPFVLPLVDEAVQILRNTPREVGRDFVFGERGAGFSSWTRSKRMLDPRHPDRPLCRPRFASIREDRLRALRRAAAHRGTRSESCSGRRRCESLRQVQVRGRDRQRVRPMGGSCRVDQWRRAQGDSDQTKCVETQKYKVVYFCNSVVRIRIESPKGHRLAG